MKKHSLEHLKSIPLWEMLERSPKKDLILEQQGVNGLYEALFRSESSAQFKMQKRRNLHYLEMAHQFIDSIEKTEHRPCFLKGSCLVGELYPGWGERFMSDVDIYCTDMKAMEEAALSFGMKRTHSEESYWLGNAHKREFYLETSLGNIPFEFHSKLFWHKDDPSELKYFSYQSSFGLGLEEMLVFLIGHYAFQHTCQKLYWLFDIYLFIDRFDAEINYKKLSSLVEHFNFSRSVLIVKGLMKTAFDFEWSSIGEESRFPIRESFLLEDSQRHWYYLFLKIYLKGGVMNNIKYNIAWLKK